MFNTLKEDAVKAPQTIGYKLKHYTATLDDQDEALKRPETAYQFARDISGADIQRCQEAACKAPGCAYYFAYNIKGADIKVCQEAACKKPQYAYYFARNIKGADIKKCQDATRADKNNHWSNLLYIYIKTKC